MWKVAVIGSGSFACGQYFPNIATTADAVCVAAVDTVFKRAQDACRRFGIPHAYRDVQELLEDCEFDIAIDAASIPEHHKINMTLLAAGKHVISQKPAALTTEEMTQQIVLAREKGVLLTCIPIHAMRPDILRAKQLMECGAIGDILSVKCVSTHGGPEYFQYRESDPSWFFGENAGAMFDMGVHGLHQVTALMGPAKRVACMAQFGMKERIVRSGALDGKRIKTDEIPDQYFITLEFANGRIGFVDTGFCQRATRSVPLEIFGTSGTISFDPPGTTWPDPKLYVDSAEHDYRGWIELMPGTNPPQRIRNQCCCLRDMTDALEHGTKPLLMPEHHRHVLEIMCKIPEAIRTGSSMTLETDF